MVTAEKGGFSKKRLIGRLSSESKKWHGQPSSLMFPPKTDSQSPILHPSTSLHKQMRQ